MHALWLVGKTHISPHYFYIVKQMKERKLCFTLLQNTTAIWQHEGNIENTSRRREYIHAQSSLPCFFLSQQSFSKVLRPPSRPLTFWYLLKSCKTVSKTLLFSLLVCIKHESIRNFQTPNLDRI